MNQDPPPHRFPVRVYFEDTDVSGVVYHASYLRFLERGRTEFLRDFGVSHTDIAARTDRAPAAFAVRAMMLDFRAPAHMDDLLSVETTLARLAGASVTMRQAVRRGPDMLVDAEVRIALVANGRPQRLPSWLTERLGPGRQPRFAAGR